MEYVFGEYSLCTRRLQLLRDEAPLALEPQVFALLRLLIENHSRVVSRDEIFEVIWKDRTVTDAALSSRIKVARAAIGDDGATQSMIRTVHGRGFHFVAEISIRDDPPDPSIRASADVSRPSLALLPFEMLSPTPEQEAFGLGLEHDISMALGRIRALYLADNAGGADARRVAADLGVTYLLSGRMRFAGSAFRLNTALLRADRMEEVWSEQFKGEIDDPFSAQDRVTTAVLGVLVPSILMVEVRRAAREDSDANSPYHDLLRAIPLSMSSEREDNAGAISLLQSAIARDADYGLAHALLSWCLAQQLVYLWSEDPTETKAEVLRHARIGVRLSPTDSIVLTFAANAETSVGELSAADHHIREALALDPNFAWAWSRLGYVHLFRGEFDDAIEAYKRALRLSPHDPMRHSVYFGLGATYFAQEEYSAALRWLDQALIEHPDMLWVHRLVAACSAEIGDRDRAERSVDLVRSYLPEATAESLASVVPVVDPEFRARLLSSYKKAGF